MGIQKFRADKAGPADGNNAVPFYTDWFGGPTLALIRNCPTPFGARTVYIRDYPDTYFSIPAACTVKGKTVSGWVGVQDGNYYFRVIVKE